MIIERRLATDSSQKIRNYQTVACFSTAALVVTKGKSSVTLWRQHWLTTQRSFYKQIIYLIYLFSSFWYHGTFSFHFVCLSSLIQNTLITFANGNEEQQQMGSKVQVLPFTFSNQEFPENDLESFPLQPSPISQLFGLDILMLKPLWQGVRSLKVTGLPLLICTCLSRPYLPTWLSLCCSFPVWTDSSVKKAAERSDFKSSRHTKALPFSKIPPSVTWLICCTLFSLGFIVFCYYNSSCVQTASCVYGGEKKLYQHYVIGDVCNTVSMWLSQWKVRELSRWTGSVWLWDLP